MPIIPPNQPINVPSGSVGRSQEAQDLDSNVYATQSPSPDISIYSDTSHQHIPPDPPAGAVHTIANHDQPGSAEPPAPEEEARLKNVHYPVEPELVLPSEWKAVEKKSKSQKETK